MAALAGANVVYGMGMLGQGLIFDYSKLMMDVEVSRMIYKIIDGIPVNEESLAIDLIKKIGPGGEYVSCDHTYKYFRTVPSQPKLICKSTKETWIANGSTSFTDRGYEAAIKLIENCKTLELSPEVKDRMRKIVNEAEDYYGVERSDY
jgi:trimethylamine--corrinoid protein Co-methyltransferase